ncbi:MAG: DEAD/DEAH box helicase [Lentisphaeraceae bacterium]|nr:DEAD/DEAH box helicase [Lentisphaeraceae bacterium]
MNIESYPVELLSKLQSSGFSSAFPIQELACGVILSGKCCYLKAPTGSGKTLSYLLPIGMMLEKDNSLNVVTLGSSPELVSQIHNVFKESFPEISSMLLVGGANPKRQKERLKKKPRFIASTPGKAFELFSQKKLLITESTILIVDEVDRVIDGGNLDKVSRMLESGGQTIMASATYNEASLELIDDLTSDFVEVQTEKREGTISHQYVFCNDDKKDISLVKLIRKFKIPSSLVFVNDLRHASHLLKELEKNNIPSAKLDSTMLKNQREQTIRELRSGKIQVLLTSDSLARGMDFQDVMVIQYGVTRDLDTYIHRSGRTGRAGKDGTCISLITGKDAYLLTKLSKKLSIEIQEIKITETKPRRKKSEKKSK